MIEERIPIKIFGQTYEVLGDPSETLYYNSLARYVESKMLDIQKGTNIVSSQKIAILAALNIADELLHERESKTTTSKSSEKKVDELIKLLDATFSEAKITVQPVMKPEPAPKRTMLPLADQEPAFNFD